MWKPFARLFQPAPAPHETVRVDPKYFDRLATAESVAGREHDAPDEFRTKSTRAREILDSLDAKDGVTIQSLEAVSDYWSNFVPRGSDEVEIRNLGIELPPAMVELIEAQLTISAHALDALGFEKPLGPDS